MTNVTLAMISHMERFRSNSNVGSATLAQDILNLIKPASITDTPQFPTGRVDWHVRVDFTLDQVHSQLIEMGRKFEEQRANLCSLARDLFEVQARLAATLSPGRLPVEPIAGTAPAVDPAPYGRSLSGQVLTAPFATQRARVDQAQQPEHLPEEFLKHLMRQLKTPR